MMNGFQNEGRKRRAALVAAVVVFCTPALWGAWGQHGGAAHSAPHYSAPRAQPAPSEPRSQGQYKPGSQQYPGRPQGGANTRPAYPGATPGRALNQNIYGRTGQAVRAYPGAAPPGHLGAWLNEHRGVPVQDQERMLRSDPSFDRLPPSDQQRLMQQLHQVNQMPEQQRERRLARAELLEHMSPQDRMAANLAGRRWRTLPPNRQALMGNAFRDLSAVPPDQRQMVLNSSRYQNTFSPEERGILTDVLRAEPYQPPK